MQILQLKSRQLPLYSSIIIHVCLSTTLAVLITINKKYSFKFLNYSYALRITDLDPSPSHLNRVALFIQQPFLGFSLIRFVISVSHAHLNLSEYNEYK